ncbi:MAG: hypothetical protein DWQ01_19285 [Planctomycetota bacterium]|nr:MAG: hypothetical protein DWQ01_19285 [Planctomycetota bacterium]
MNLSSFTCQTRKGSAFLLALAALASAPLAGQETAPGFTLMAPLGSTDTFLLDAQGEIAHQWPSNFNPGNAVYLLENGNLLRTIHTRGNIGGSGGGVQEIQWDGTVVWDYRYDGTGVLQHHDVEVLPNGNVLMIAWEDKTIQQAVAAGRDPSLMQGTVFSPDHVIEVQKTGPTSGQIVWEWHLWDHLIQDFDSSQANYGDVAAHPELVDINFPAQVVRNGDWAHCNGIDYNPVLDQILISVHNLNEIWVIDHSTTTAEAAGHSGGNSGKGGDLLYRWGNPQAYRAGTANDQQFFGQHDATWIEANYPGQGNILVFNNGLNRPGPRFSSVDELEPPVNANGQYFLAPGSAYGPAAPVWSYTAPTPTDFYSGAISGAERLQNGNTLICSGTQGWLFEVDLNQNLIWEHFNDIPSSTQNSVFKVRRYAHYLWPDRQAMSASAGGQVELQLQAGSEHAFRSYWLLASMSGTEPGTPLPGGQSTLPLNHDALGDWFLANLNGPALQNFAGNLDASGGAAATLDTLGPLAPSYIGQTVHFAFALRNPWDFASNPMALLILP